MKGDQTFVDLNLASPAMANWYLTYSIFLLFAFPLREGKDRYFKGTIKFPGAILKYANFAQFRNHTLKTTVVMETRTVMSDEECLLSCSESPNCRSLNFNTTPDGQGRHLCQILDTDKFVSHFDFVVSSEFHHFSCTVSSLSSRHFYIKRYSIIIEILILQNLKMRCKEKALLDFRDRSESKYFKFDSEPGSS